MRNTVHLEAKSNYEFLEEQGFVFTDIVPSALPESIIATDIYFHCYKEL